MTLRIYLNEKFVLYAFGADIDVAIYYDGREFYGRFHHGHAAKLFYELGIH